MKPILFSPDETEFRTNGLGRISPLSCMVTEERNGQFELEAVVSIDDPHFFQITEGNILYSLHDDTHDKQPFEIYKISRPLNGKVTVNAQHITYRTAKMTVMPFTAGSITDAMEGLAENTVGGCPFTFWTDKTTDGAFTVSTPVTLRSQLAGSEGSLLDTYGTGEYEWDHFTIKLHRSRGSNTGTVLRYGKNITELKKTTDSTNVWTGVCPYWYGADETTGENILVTLPEQAVYAGTVDDYSYKMVIPLDLTGEFTNPPTEDALRTRARAYIAANAAQGIPTTIEVSFIALWQTEEYKNVAELQRLHLCDTLTVRYPRLGVKNTAKIVKTVYNVLLERYDSMTIGESKSSLGSTIQAAADEVKKTTPTLTAVEQAIAAATNMLSGAQGGYVAISQDDSGKPYEILVMDQPDVNDAGNILRLDKAGVSFSDSGYTGTFTTVWTLAGDLSADCIKKGTMSANRVRGGTFAAKDGAVLADLDKGTINLNGQSTANNNTAISEDGKLSAVDADISGRFTTEGDGKKTVLEDGEVKTFEGNTRIYPAASLEQMFVLAGENVISEAVDGSDTGSDSETDAGDGSETEQSATESTVEISFDGNPLVADETAMYQVFLQPHAAGTCYITARTESGFTVTGTPGLAFSWLAVGKRKEDA